MTPEERSTQPLSSTDSVNPKSEVQETAGEPARKSLFSTHWESAEDVQEVESYRQWSLLAILALLCGVVSLTAFMYSYCVFIAIGGILLSLWAYFHVKRSQGALLGSKAALWGLSLSIIAIVGVSVLWSYYQYTVRTEANRFLRIWFDAVKSKNIRLVMEMKNPTWSRKLDSDLTDWWKSKLTHKGETDREFVDIFITSINDPCLKTLWALGDRADITYYKTINNFYHDSKDSLVMIYAVTVAKPDDVNDRETFFIKLGAERTRNPRDTTQLGWAITSFPSLFKELPEELKGKMKNGK